MKNRLRSGISLLKARISSSSELFEILGIDQLPLSFKIFIKAFELGYDMIDYSMVVINKKPEFFVKLTMFENYMINDEEYNATLDLIFPISDLLKEYSSYKLKVDKWHDLDFMKIGLLFHGDIILMGLGKENSGEIWRWGNGLLNTQYCKLDNNIFDFVNRLNEEIDNDQMDYFKIQTNELYKLWGEKYWWVKNT